GASRRRYMLGWNTLDHALLNASFSPGGACSAPYTTIMHSSCPRMREYVNRVGVASAVKPAGTSNRAAPNSRGPCAASATGESESARTNRRRCKRPSSGDNDYGVAARHPESSACGCERSAKERGVASIRHHSEAVIFRAWDFRTRYQPGFVSIVTKKYRKPNSG